MSFLIIMGKSLNGGGDQRFCDDSTRALLIKSKTMDRIDCMSKNVWRNIWTTLKCGQQSPKHSTWFLEVWFEKKTVEAFFYRDESIERNSWSDKPVLTSTDDVICLFRNILQYLQ